MTAAAARRRAAAGEIVAVDDGMVTNVELGHDGPPAGDPWRAWLFVVRLKGEELASDVVEVEAESRPELDAVVRGIVDEVGGRSRALSKDWPSPWSLP